MTDLVNWLSNSLSHALSHSLYYWPSAGVMHSLGWTLLHFLWQGAALGAGAAVLMTLCQRASTRYAVGVGTLALMVAAPVATFFLLTPTGVGGPAGTGSAAATIPMAIANIMTETLVRTAAATPSVPGRLPSSPLPDVLPWLVEAWLLGVALFSLRTAGGFLLLERGRRKRSAVISARVLEMCQTVQRRLGLERTVGYCECLWLQAPAVIGWFRPIVLLPVTALTGLSEGQLESVIAHELAHIQRFDSFVNLFQIAVETLLFYHPAVWWLNQRIRAEREHCCDEVAVSVCGNPIEYARALTLMEEWRSAPVLAMAANRGPLSERVFRVLGRSGGRRGMGLTGGVLCLAVALVAGNALLGIAYPKPTVHASESSAASASPAVAAAPQSDTTTAGAATAASAPTPAAKPSSAQSSSAQSRTASQPPVAATSYIDAMKAAGLGDLSVDQLIALKIHDVTPDYVRGMAEQGLHVDADSLIAMRIQGANPEYVRDLRGVGLAPDAHQIVALKIQGVDAAYVRGLEDAGIQPGVHQLVAMKIQGVTPAYVRELRELGLRVDVDTLVALRIQRVDAEYVRDINALGLKPDTHQFIVMRIQDVSPEYVKGLQDAGLKLDVDELIGAKIQGITKEFVDSAVKHGFQDLSLHKLMELKRMGILDTPGEI